MAKSKMFSHISTLLSSEYRRTSHEMRCLVFIRLVKDDEKILPSIHIHYAFGRIVVWVFTRSFLVMTQFRKALLCLPDLMRMSCPLLVVQRSSWCL